MSYSLSQLSIYPIKSIKGIPLQKSQVETEGLWGDRRYMLVKPNGECVTGRKYPKLTLVTAELMEESKWLLSHPIMTSNTLLDPNHLSNQYKEVMVFDVPVRGLLVSETLSHWFSELLEENVELVFFGEKSTRQTPHSSSVAFADTYPFLLTTEASLEELNRTCPENIVMAQFRPNLVIKGSQAFEEDSWKRIRIGEVEFENVKPCVRCIFTTLDPETTERSRKGEPLKTLGKFRLLEKEGITFGINMIALNTGTIKLDDTVEVLEYKEPEAYIDRR